MKFISASVALIAAGAAHAQSGTARFGLKGGKFDINGFAANGLDVFGFDKNGKDAWGRPISDTSAGLVAPVGKANEPKQPEAPAHHEKDPKHHHKAPKPVNPTPTPFHTPTYTTIAGSKYPVVESTVVFPLSTITDTVIRTYSIDIQPTSAPIRPVESTRASCYGGQATLALKFPCPSESNNFMAEMLIAELAYVTQTNRNDWDLLVNDGKSVTVITCSQWAYNQLDITAYAHPEMLNALMYNPTDVTLCQPHEDIVTGNCAKVPLECSGTQQLINGQCTQKRRAVRDVDCNNGQFFDSGFCSKCTHIPGCSEVSCRAASKSTCNQCVTGLSVSAIGGCN